ncbi:MAG: hypothetical protein AVDCRST_MAG68-566 [uncultured Gemmatimonadetes bacterium]|uniref:TnsE C-terminal domain-containing protein n=1 Tax=uncultured Gemmatimonadota bacterium TaxID=203437 RepID=A0A6J4KB30_9BACT|nr:MAG: hypothetical protein AVDCRST_MAG68-566 [uncultured Gemmatimonadota bacterium]
MFDKDAPIVARLCFSDVARQRVLGVWGSIQKNNNGVHRWPVPEALPPFDGPTNMRVHGYRVRTKVDDRTVSYFVVFWIEECSAPFPFRSLEYSRDNDNRQGDDTVEEPGARGGWESKPGRRRGKPSDPHHQNAEPTKKTVLHKEILTDARFRALKDMWIKKVPKPVSHRTRKAKERIPKGEYKGFGTGEGTHGDSPYDRLAVTTDLQEKDNGRDEEIQKDTTRNGLDAFADALAEVDRQLSFVVGFREITVFGDRTVRPPASLLPPPENGQPRWLYIEPETSRRRHLLLAEVDRHGQFMYLAELERRPGEHFRIAIFAAPDWRRLDDADLQIVLQVCAENKGVWRRWAPTAYEYIMLNHPNLQLERAEYVAKLEKELVRALNRYAGEV